MNYITVGPTELEIKDTLDFMILTQGDTPQSLTYSMHVPQQLVLTGAQTIPGRESIAVQSQYGVVNGRLPFREDEEGILYHLRLPPSMPAFAFTVDLIVGGNPFYTKAFHFVRQPSGAYSAFVTTETVEFETLL
jgi:hypothetical protein